MKPLLSYEATNMFRDAVGLYGATQEELSSNAKRLADAKRALLAEWKTGTQGWLGCPDEAKLIKRVLALVAAKRQFTTCLVLGIGGSDLGARAAYQALKHTGRGMKLEFAGANTDPDELAEIFSRIDLKKTLVNIISKSGDTVEPMSAFLIVRDALIARVGKRYAEHIVATTDESKGSLHDLAEQEGYATLPVPGNIGGRFSVLTAVGLFPLACAGIDIKKLVAGAKHVRDGFVESQPSKHAASLHALLHVLANTERRQHIHVLMPYSARLELFGKWYRQIWAESLGKKVNNAGDHVNVGPTPVAALGATDQHSQIQLYVEGPNDKIVTFIEVEKSDAKLRVPASVKAIKSLAYLSNVSLERILHAERAATAEALRQAQRPNGTISIPRISPETLGALFMHFEIATAVAGHLYGVNPYDQPGVEAGKAEMRRLIAGA